MAPKSIKLRRSTPAPRARSPPRRERRIRLKTSLQSRPLVKKTNLLDLPNELLNMIYAFSIPVYVKTDIISTATYKRQCLETDVTHSHAVIPALCQVNSKLRRDTLPMFLGTTNSLSGAQTEEQCSGDGKSWQTGCFNSRMHKPRE